MANDPDQVRLLLIVRMYAQRFPYEELEGDRQHGKLG